MKHLKYGGITIGISLSAWSDAYAGQRDIVASVLVPMLIGILVLFIVFLIFRELACWYWKINETIALLIGIYNILLKSLSETSDMDSSVEKKCPSCAEKIKIEAKKCRFCGEEFDLAQIEQQTEAEATQPVHEIQE